MCTSINPPNLICEDCTETYLQDHTPGDLSFQDVELTEDLSTLDAWGARCPSNTAHFVPQLCPADAAKQKAWALRQPPEPPC